MPRAYNWVKDGANLFIVLRSKTKANKDNKSIPKFSSFYRDAFDTDKLLIVYWNEFWIETDLGIGILSHCWKESVTYIAKK